MDSLFASMLNSYDGPKDPVLDSFDLEGFVNYLQKNKCNKVIVMAGAGISTSAGIPDFRTPGTGLYDNLQKYELEEPTDIFDISFFRENPNPFYYLAKELYPGLYHPTLCHYFIRLLDEKGMLLRHYTQNIDTLERVAGVEENKLVEAHGSFASAHCIDCYAEMDPDLVKEKVMAEEVPQCEACGEGIVKPDIVFFGESLPERFSTLVKEDFEEADALIIMGTSLKVSPFNTLITRVPTSVPRLLMNMEPVGEAPGMFQGRQLEFNRKIRDVFYKGTCDDGCLAFAELMGWKDDLKELHETEVAKLPPSHAVQPAKEKVEKEEEETGEVTGDADAEEQAEGAGKGEEGKEGEAEAEAEAEVDGGATEADEDSVVPAAPAAKKIEEGEAGQEAKSEDD